MLATHRQPLGPPHISYIVDLLIVILTNNHFDFNGACFHQVSGTTKGTKLGPSYGNLFVTKFEESHVYTYPLQTISWKGSLITS